jgi:hypothetical protein
MNEAEFGEFLRRGGRSSSAASRCIRLVQEFEVYLREYGKCQTFAEAGSDDLESFVRWIEREPKASANTHLWALRYYYDYRSNEEMRHLAGILRQQRIERKPFPLKGFLGVDAEDLKRLDTAGIHTSDQMLLAGKTPAKRLALADTTGIPEERILELVKLSDLARIRGVKGTRARLYYDAGIETVDQLAKTDPGKLRATVVEFVERTGFDGVATLPAEARFTVEEAQKLLKVLEQ